MTTYKTMLVNIDGKMPSHQEIVDANPSFISLGYRGGMVYRNRGMVSPMVGSGGCGSAASDRGKPQTAERDHPVAPGDTEEISMVEYIFGTVWGTHHILQYQEGIRDE